MLDCRYAPQALADLYDISARIALDDPQTAQKVMRRIETSIETVCLFPSVGKRSSRPSVFVYGGTKHQPFRFTFQVHDDHILVLRVFRHSRGKVLT